MQQKWLFVITPKTKLIDLNLKEVWHYRDLLMLFVKRDVITLYKQTILGPLWYLIQPLFTSVIFTLVFNNVAGIQTGGIPPFLFNLAGITTWNYFKECLTATSDTFKKNEQIFGKVYFPRAVYAQKNDTRITKFGKFLRKTRLDEVPQFFNILRGDMSIIGPRPERPEFVKNLEEKVPFYAIRHVVKPGLTGWAQVKFPYAGTLEEQEKKLRYDLFYIKEQSMFLDFKIIIKTITTVLFFRGQ